MFNPFTLLLCANGSECPDGYLCMEPPPEFEDIPNFMKICMPDPYGKCPDPQNPGDACLAPTATCKTVGAGMTPSHHMCATSCNPQDPEPKCPTPPGVQNPTFCAAPTDTDHTCWLDCTSVPCPAGMECVKGLQFADPQVVNDVCLWPVEP